MRPLPNYVADRNPFHLAKPPTWWLSGMLRFDPDLVLIPSRCKPLFVLGRRRRLSQPLGAVIDRKLRLDDPAHTGHAAMCDAYGLVVVTTLFVAGDWTTSNLQVFLDELTRRDTWRRDGPLDESGQRAALFEGGSKLAKEIDDHDISERAKLDRNEREKTWHATGDAWRSRQARTGSRVLNAGSPSPRGLIATPSPMPAPRGRLIGV